MTDTRSTSALFKRAEQLKRWEDSDTNKQPPTPKSASRVQFSTGIVFLAACTSGDKDEVERLIKMGADINTANVDGLTALHQACIDDNLDMVEFLVAHGADINRGDNEGWTPLHATASCGFLSIARFLLENGADVAAVNADAELAVDIAESDAMESLLQKVIDEKGIDCDKSRNAELNNLLADAKNWAVNGYVEIRDPKTGGTPLHFAAAKGYTDVVRIILEECNVDPDCVDYEGWTPLHAAALWGQKETAAVLLKNGADPDFKNYSGQTCVDLVDPAISSWLTEACLKAPKRIKNNNNNNKRKLSPPKLDVKQQNTRNTDKNSNDKPPLAPPPEIINKADGKPPKARAPSPDAKESATNTGDDSPSWRRSTSLRSINRELNKNQNNNSDDTILRRTHSFENDKTILNPPEKKEREAVSWNPTPTATPTTTPTPITNSTSPSPTQTTVRRSFVPPVRDEESETQRKAHAKRVRETRRSTQGVTLDEIKSAEQFVKKNSAVQNSTPPETPTSPSKTSEPAAADNKVSNPASAVSSVTLALACASATATATIAAAGERRPSWRLRLDPTNKFQLENASTTQPPAPAPATPDTVVTIPLRRVTTNTTAEPPSGNAVEEDKDKENNPDSKASGTAPSSTQAALNVIQRRRRPKRRSTGVGHVDMDDIVNDRGGGGEGDCEPEPPVVITERTSYASHRNSTLEIDYKSMYEASVAEVKRLRGVLDTSEQQLREARATISRVSTVTQTSQSENDIREKRAMERKLSEMEEELKYMQVLQVENQRLKDENGALIRVISKLSK